MADPTKKQQREQEEREQEEREKQEKREKQQQKREEREHEEREEQEREEREREPSSRRRHDPDEAQQQNPQEPQNKPQQELKPLPPGQSEVQQEFEVGVHLEGTTVREGPEGPRPGTPRQAPAAGDIFIGSPGVDEAEMTAIQMEPHPESSPEILNAPFAQPLPQPDAGLGTEGRRLAEERMAKGHIPNDPEPPLPRIKVDQSPKFAEDLSARDAREAEKVSTGGATQQQNQVFAGQVRPEEGRANLNVNTPKGEHLLGKQDITSRLPRPPLDAGGKRQERKTNDTGPGRNAVSGDAGRDQRSREHDPGRGPRDRDPERAANRREEKRPQG